MVWCKMKCKICKQECGWFYPFFNGGKCIHCKIYIDHKLNPIEVDEEWVTHHENSKVACDKYLDDKEKNILEG